MALGIVSNDPIKFHSKSFIFSGCTFASGAQQASKKRKRRSPYAIGRGVRKHTLQHIYNTFGIKRPRLHSYLQHIRSGKITHWAALYRTSRKKKKKKPYPQKTTCWNSLNWILHQKRGVFDKSMGDRAWKFYVGLGNYHSMYLHGGLTFVLTAYRILVLYSSKGWSRPRIFLRKMKTQGHSKNNYNVIHPFFSLFLWEHHNILVMPRSRTAECKLHEPDPWTIQSSVYGDKYLSIS